MYGVSAVYAAGDGFQDGQCGPDCGLILERHACRHRASAQEFVLAVWRRKGDLVARHHGITPLEQVEVFIGDVGASGTIDEHRIFHRKAGEGFEIGSVRGALSDGQELFGPGQVDPSGLHDIPAAVGESYHAYAFSGTRRDFFAVAADKFHKRPSHPSETGDEQVDYLLAALVEELVVDALQGFVNPLGRHDYGYVPFGRTLRGGPDADAAAAEGCQHLPGGSALVEDVVAHEADYREAFLYLEGVQFAERDFVCERGVGGFLGAVGILLRDGNAHGVHRRSLGDKDDVDAAAAQRVEEAAGKARYPHHSAPFQGEQGDVVGI